MVLDSGLLKILGKLLYPNAVACNCSGKKQKLADSKLPFCNLMDEQQVYRRISKKGKQSSGKLKGSLHSKGFLIKT